VLVPATLALAIALALVPDVAQKVRASSYVETAEGSTSIFRTA
jgi:hypothetical protein